MITIALQKRALSPVRLVLLPGEVTHERALSPADLFGGKAPVGALVGLLERIF
jgi:hypothetical protein